MDIIVSAFELLLRWDVIIALLIGSCGGVVIGAIPGVGPAVAIAIPIRPSAILRRITWSSWMAEIACFTFTEINSLALKAVPRVYGD